MMCKNHYKKPETKDECPHLRITVIIGVTRYLEEMHRVTTDPMTKSQTWTKMDSRDPGNKDSKWIVRAKCDECGESIDMDLPSGEEFE